MYLILLCVCICVFLLTLLHAQLFLPLVSSPSFHGPLFSLISCHHFLCMSSMCHGAVHGDVIQLDQLVVLNHCEFSRFLFVEFFRSSLLLPLCVQSSPVQISRYAQLYGISSSGQSPCTAAHFN